MEDESYEWISGPCIGDENKSQKKSGSGPSHEELMEMLRDTEEYNEQKRKEKATRVEERKRKALKLFRGLLGAGILTLGGTTIAILGYYRVGHLAVLGTAMIGKMLAFWIPGILAGACLCAVIGCGIEILHLKHINEEDSTCSGEIMSNPAAFGKVVTPESPELLKGLGEQDYLS